MPSFGTAHTSTLLGSKGFSGRATGRTRCGFSTKRSSLLHVPSTGCCDVCARFFVRERMCTAASSFTVYVAGEEYALPTLGWSRLFAHGMMPAVTKTCAVL